MLLKIVSAAVFVAVMGPIVASAQTVAQIGQPAERPPVSFKGAQYVDSRGCVFMNASYGGAAQWVARVDRKHKVLCGYPPTFGPKPAIEVAEDVAPVAPKPVVPAVVVAASVPVMVKPAKANAPMATVASAMMPDAVEVRPAPREPLEHSPVGLAANLPSVAQSYDRVAAGPAEGKIGCFTDAPRAEVVRLRNGGTAVVCTRGDGTLDGWRSPIYPRSAGVGAALRDPVQVTRADNAGVGRVAAAAAPVYAAAAAAPDVPDVVVPKGYKVAWTDGRLNPMRGIGTAEGQAAQDQLWTRKVPQKLISDVQKAKARKHKKAGTVTVSSMNAAPVAQPTAAAGGAWVQIGTFGVPANAAGAAAQLQALGLPVAKSKLHRGGKDLQIVLAGPFGSGADAQAALRLARGAGFGDAYIR